MASSVRHFSDYLQKLLVQQSENFGPVFFGQGESSALIVEGIVGSAVLQQSFGPVVEVVNDRFDLGAQIWADGKVRAQALVELAFEIADPFFDGLIIEIGRASCRERV